MYSGLQYFTSRSRLHVQSSTIPMAPPCQDTNTGKSVTLRETELSRIQISFAFKSFRGISVKEKYCTLNTHHFGYCFKVEARQFNDVSQFEYGTERSILWMVKAFTDVFAINTLHQVTPKTTVNIRKHHFSEGLLQKYQATYTVIKKQI